MAEEPLIFMLEISPRTVKGSHLFLLPCSGIMLPATCSTLRSTSMRLPWSLRVGRMSVLLRIAGTHIPRSLVYASG